MVRTAFAVVVSTLLVAGSAAAEQKSSIAEAVTASAVTAAYSAPAEPQLFKPVAPMASGQLAGDRRPTLLPAAYVSLAALQTYDMYSTRKVLKQGGVEANPVMRGVVGNPATLAAVKGATTFAAVYMAERLWRTKHRRAAVVLMIATNGLMATVSAHNASVLRHQR